MHFYFRQFNVIDVEIVELLWHLYIRQISFCKVVVSCFEIFEIVPAVLAMRRV
jgi:hypothetical protein